MSRGDDQHLEDIAVAIAAIKRHLTIGTIAEEVVFDAVRMRLIEIGEAVKTLSEEAKSRESSIPWRQISGMRDRLTHHYFESDRQIIEATLTNDIEPLSAAVARLIKLDE